MDQRSFEDPSWYLAMTLTERLASLRAVQYTIPQMEVDANFAERRMQHWRSQRPFRTGSHFAQRLAIDGMSEDEFLYLLGEPVESMRDRFSSSPGWLTELAQAFSRPASSKPIKSIPLPDSLRGQEVAGFLEVTEPFINYGRDRLHQAVHELVQTQADLLFDPGTIEQILFMTLPWWLIQMSSRTMALELNVARLQGLLNGDTPEARFRSFLEHLRRHDVAHAIFQEYPVLVRQLMMCINQWVDFSVEFLQRLCADREALRTMLSPGNDPGLIVEVDGGVSDRHRDGRVVLILKFSSGFQMVYKPRSLAVDVHFQELLTWFNNRGNHPPFQTLRVLDRGAYGWVEFVTAKSCASSEEIRHFYERQGGYLALLYAIEATDFHSENIIAVREYPLLIDLEGLFHPRVGGIDLEPGNQLTSGIPAYSVLRVGLLPERIWTNAKSEGIDISGLGGPLGQLTPFAVPYCQGVGTDVMRFIRKRVAMPESENRPSLNGADLNPLDYADAIATGFTNIYRLLLRYRDDLMSDGGPMARFIQDEVRVLLRPTQTYGVLLRESFHPDVLRNALDRDRLFDQLWRTVEYWPHLAKVIPAERRDLLKGDVPIFTTRPGSRDLWSSSNERIVNFFDEPSLSRVQRRLQQLSDDDLAKQLWFIRASLATLTIGIDQTQSPTYRLTEPQVTASHERLLGAARAVGDRLETLALRGESNVAWIGLALKDERDWRLIPLGIDLYDGLPGITLFLAYLGAITGEERYTTLAQAALTTIRRYVERRERFITSIGGFNGWGGLIYTLAHLAMLWDQPTLLAQAQAMVERLPALIERDEQLDVIGGAAGCIGSLLCLYRCTPSDRALAAAMQCGDRLITCAQPMEHGIGWLIPRAGARPLTGFSHGAAGMASSLMGLATLTGEERFRTAILAAIAYERSLFSPKAGNWPDLRELGTSNQTVNNDQTSFMTAWCHGAPGIGLGRLQCLRHLHDGEIRAEINAALKITLEQGFGLNHSLCHGDLGNVELFLQASQTLDDPKWNVELNRIATVILKSINREGWLCGTPSRVESPGLMTGLAGIGYGLLRLAEPTLVPSVLTLEPPRIA